LAALLAIYNWQGADDYAKNMTLCVHPTCRRRSNARVLLDSMVADMRQLGMHIFKAETRVSNLAIQALFEKQGYKRTLLVERMMEHPLESDYKYELRP
jgi:ribosomal protein S18 acetylase RimI-like enzyme